MRRGAVYFEVMQDSSFLWVRVLYVLAWLSLAAFLGGLTFSSGEEASAWLAATGALYYTVPPALLGIGVLRASLAMPWSGGHRVRFFGRHLALALAYASLSGAATASAFRWMWRGDDELSVAGIFVGQCFLSTLTYCLLVGFTYAAVGEIRRRQEAAATARAEALRAQAELKALRAQVNPHFLFNTLHSLLALVRSDPRAAEEALEQLGDLMRYALRFQQEVRDEVALAEEWAFTEDYLALERLRLGARLQVDASITRAALAHRVPAFSLQPLLENAIRHAIAPRAAGGRIEVAADVVDGRLRLEVEDDGPGATGEAVEASRGTGLRLLRDRLAALYGDQASLTTHGASPGFRVLVDMPATPAPEEGERDA